VHAIHHINTAESRTTQLSQLALKLLTTREQPSMDYRSQRLPLQKAPVITGTFFIGASAKLFALGTGENANAAVDQVAC
jgi:hypothetical protein